jgi:hypothetical protein
MGVDSSMVNFANLRRFIHRIIYNPTIESDITFRQDVGLNARSDLQETNDPTATRKKSWVAKIIDNAWKETDVYRSIKRFKLQGLDLLEKLPNLMNVIGEATNVAIARKSDPLVLDMQEGIRLGE